MTIKSSSFTIWVVESKEAPNEALRAALENGTSTRAPMQNVSVRYFSDDELTKPLRFAMLPDLLIFCAEWGSSAAEQFVKTAGAPPVWIDLIYQNAKSLAAFRTACQLKGIDGSSVELSARQLDWTFCLIDAYRNDFGSLLNCVANRDMTTPTIFSSRLAQPHEIGVRIDYLTKKIGGAPALHWYTVVSSLATLSLGILAELRLPTSPALPFYATELVDKHWLIVFQIPVGKKQQAKASLILSKFREESSAWRNGLAYTFLTRECGALVATFAENVIEMGVVFSPAEVFGSKLVDPQQFFRDAFVVRRRSTAANFNPQNCRYSPFPERMKPKEVTTVEVAAVESEAAGSVGGRLTMFEKAQEQLAHIYRAGSDESFLAYLKGVDASSGVPQARYVTLIEATEKGGSAEQRELMKDLMKRFFALVEEAKQSKKQRAS